MKTIVKLLQALSKYITILVSTTRMRLAIKGATAVHNFEAKAGKYIDKNYKELRNYIVLLELPVKNKKGQILVNVQTKLPVMKRRLFWINRHNFRKIKKIGWIPKQMKLDELRYRAFYVTNPLRTYRDEYKLREEAINRYKDYTINNTR